MTSVFKSVLVATMLCSSLSMASTWVPVGNGDLTIFVPLPDINDLTSSPYSTGSTVSISVGDTTSNQAYYYRAYNEDTGSFSGWACQTADLVSSNDNQILISDVSSGTYRYQVSACMTGSGCDVSGFQSGELACSDQTYTSNIEVLDRSGTRTPTVSDSTREFVGATGGQFRVSESGAATYSVPISIPAGTAGVQPEVSLQYSSQGGSGLVGHGWSLAASSSIARCPKTFIHDGKISGVNYTNSDRLCLDGQRLILNGRATLQTPSATGEIYEEKTDAQYWSTSAVYHTEVDSQLYVRPNYVGGHLVGFTVENKAGEIHYYGKTNRETDSNDKAISEKLLKYSFKVNGSDDTGEDAFHETTEDSNIAKFWALKAVRDIRDNYILYRYNNNEPHGEHNLSEIVYTGNTAVSPVLSPYASIRFDYAQNKKPRSGWTAGYPWQATKLLKNITVSIDGEQHRKYTLGYFESNFHEERNYLETITECVEDNESNDCLRPLTFHWDKRAPVTSSSTTLSYEDEDGDEIDYEVVNTDPFKPFRTSFNSLGSHNDPGTSQIFDINGDGFADAIYTENSAWKVKLGPNFSGSATTLGSGHTDNAEYSLVFDYNGDGVQDLLVAQNTSSNWHILSYGFERQVTVRNCVSRGECYDFPKTIKTIDTGIKATGLEGKTQLLDVDGDALVDLVIVEGGDLKYFRNNGDGSFNASKVIADISQDSSLSSASGLVPDLGIGRLFRSTANLKNAASFDVNGDGRSDLIFKIIENNSHCLYRGVRIHVSGRIECERDILGEWVEGETHFWKLYVSTGEDSLTELQTLKTLSSTGPGGVTYTFDLKIVDLNGDGLSDIIYPTNNGWAYRLSDGTQLMAVKMVERLTNSGGVANLSVGDYDEDYAVFLDVNSDGRTDLLIPNSNGSAWLSYFSLGFVDNASELIFQQRGSYSFNREKHRRFADVNGDGKLDYLEYHSNWRLFAGGGIVNDAEDVISKITNGFGLETRVNYTNITNTFTYTQQDSSFRYDENGDEIPDLFSPKSAYFVVSEATSDTSPSTTGSVNNTNTVRYQYGGLLLNKKGRGMLGFEVVRSLDMQSCVTQVQIILNGTSEPGVTTYPDDCITTETRYSQEFPFIGMPLETIQSIGEGGNLISYSENTLANLTTVDKGFFPYIESSIEESYSINDSVTSTLRYGRVVSEFEYDTYGNQTYSRIEMQHASNPDTQFSYTEATSEYGNSVRYKRLGRLMKTTVVKDYRYNSYEPAQTSLTSTFTYYNDLLLKTSNDGLLTTTYGYDKFGNKESVQVVGHVDANNSVSQTRTQFSSFEDSRGRYVESTTNALGHTATSITIGMNGSDAGRVREISSTDSNGITTHVYFDKFGTKTRQTVTGADEDDPTLETYTYHSYCSSVSCPNSNAYYRTIEVSSGAPEKQVLFDAWGREVSTRVQNHSGNWTVTLKTYDSNGRVKFSYEPINVSSEANSDTYSTYYTSMTYDRMGRVQKQTNPNGSFTNYNYWQSTNHQGIDKHDQDGVGLVEYINWTGKPYRILDRKNTVTLARLDYQYTVGLNLWKANVYEDSSSYSHTQVVNTFDKYGRKVKTDDENKGIWTYDYNDFGELVSQTNSSGQTTTFTYDNAGRKLTRKDDDGFTLWTYNDSQAYADGKLTAVALYEGKSSASGTPNYSESYTFTSFGKVESQTYIADGEVFESRFSYDEFNRLRFTTYPANGFTVKNTYTSLGFPDSVVNATSGHRDEGKVYQHVDSINARGQVTSVSYGNGVTQVKDFYDNTGWLKFIGVSDGSSNVVRSQNYTYYTNGNINTRSNTYSATSSAQNSLETFTYDDMNRLDGRTHNIGGSNIQESYTYDRLGNIETNNGLNYTYDNNVANELKSVSGNGLSYSFSYDNRGNVESDGSRTFTYSSFDLPTQIKKGSTTVNFKYGTARQLYRQTLVTSDGITDKLFIGGTYERASLPSGVTEHKYTVGGIIVTDRSNNDNETLYTHKDHLGSTVSITNSAGKVQQHFMYDPWGKQTVFNDTYSLLAYTSPGDSYGYTGHKMLNELGIIHMNGRIYDPTLGRFLQADPHIQAPKNSQNYNRYSYVLNNPMSYTDPSGFSLRSCGVVSSPYFKQSLEFQF
ncbi:RHS repeat-associated core domain-containing protein [Alteromonas sp. KUL49]|uniref:RHS repeat-associated core domain-containing protein n=1 Tax=Alteromonas sp. KUL49 TaxID=2480798 RepID=UPI00102F07FD|nr:RHS repeat-associated core domain-containing protein [Alteromonas sp. KUL49]TAP39702.1 hypothetical protein EYS00_10250 [Alteromonas sp. KUL49]GEA11692.1 hypothetical protein KUL49_20670 [Alteromonas sp. KUL49]